MKNLGLIEGSTISAKDLKRRIGKHECITFDFVMDLNDILDAVEGHDIPIEGLNEKADEIFGDYCPEVNGTVTDISYCFLTKHKYHISNGVAVIRCTCSHDELEWPEDEKEQTRRDEKNGLYPEHEDVAN